MVMYPEVVVERYYCRQVSFCFDDLEFHSVTCQVDGLIDLTGPV